MLMLLCAVTAWAAPTDLPEMSADGNIKWYTIKNVRRSKFATYAGDFATMTQQANVSTASLFYFTGEVAEGVATVKIHNASAGDKLCAGYNSWTTQGCDWYIQAQATGVSIATTAAHDSWYAWNDASGAGQKVEYWGADDEGSAWAIEPVSIETIDITSIATALVEDAENIRDNRTVADSEKYTTLNAAIEAVKAVNGETEINAAITAVANLASACRNAVAVELENGVYVFKNKNNSDQVRYNGELLARGVGSLLDAGDTGYQFTVTKGNSGFYTIQTADGKFVTYSGNSGDVVKVSESNDANDANKWWAICVGNTTESVVIIPGANFKEGAAGWNYSVHDAGGNANRVVGLYGCTDGGSQWTVKRVSALATGVVKMKIGGNYASVDGENIKKDNNNASTFILTRGDNGCFTIQTTDGKYLTYSSTHNHLLTLLDGASANDGNKWWFIAYDEKKHDAFDIFPKQNGEYQSNWEAFNWSKGSNDKLGFWNGTDPASYCSFEMAIWEGYYYIKGTGTGNNAAWYMAYDENGKWKAVAETAGVKHIWKFENGANGLKLKSCNLNQYATLGDASALSSGPSPMVADFAQGSEFVFENKSENIFTIKDTNKRIVRTEGSGAVNHWGSENNETWALIPVNEVEISVNEFSTVYLPFAVETEDATVYAVEEVTSESVVLVEKADIPAGEGAIIEANGPVTLNIIKNATSDWTKNNLEGTTVNTNITDDAYVLARVDSEIGLYMAEKNQLDGTAWLNNANKAYLPASVVPAAANVKSLSFRYEGTTGIENVVVENGVNVIFDLTGRKVEAISAPGIYIVNGKKVLVK